MSQLEGRLEAVVDIEDFDEADILLLGSNKYKYSISHDSYQSSLMINLQDAKDSTRLLFSFSHKRQLGRVCYLTKSLFLVAVVI